MNAQTQHTPGLQASGVPRACSKCGASFCSSIKSHNTFCAPCRSEYDRAYRARRSAAGYSVSGKQMPRSYHRAYEAKYFENEENRLRRNALARKYQHDPRLAEKRRARRLARHAISSGRLIRKPCEVCGEIRVDAHHDDYSKPLDVRWLCRTHHAAHHASHCAKARGEA